MSESCSLLHAAHEDDRMFELGDYQGPVARWCAGCGDHSVLTAAQKLLTDEQLKPESTVFVSGIGCSSRFPHYMKTYGFHGLHGRPLPVACGVRARRPDLHVFVVTGDGVVVFDAKVINQRGELCQEGQWKVMYLMRNVG